jgi:hypothetical protein
MSAIRRLGVAVLCVTLAMAYSAGPAPAHHQAPLQQSLWWDGEGAGFKAFGPNQAVTIHTGTMAYVPACEEGGSPDTIFPWTNIYVVRTAPAPNEELTDVSGTPNTVQGASGFSGGIFGAEQIAFTKPGGTLGRGVYTVVYDECQDGRFTAGIDVAFERAFEVLPRDANVPPLPDIARIKSEAERLELAWRARWVLTYVTFNIESWKDIYEHTCTAGEVLAPSLPFMRGLSRLCPPVDPDDDGGAGDAVDTGLSLFQDAMEDITGVDPQEAALQQLINTAFRYRGIAADPPDPQFRDIVTLAARPRFDAGPHDARAAFRAELAGALAEHDALLKAMLASLERYQGAQLEHDGDWALAHARGLVRIGDDLQGSAARIGDVIERTQSLIAADNGIGVRFADELETTRSRIARDGFTADERRQALNLGYKAGEIDAARAVLADRSYAFDREEALADLGDLRTHTGAFAHAADELSAALEPVIAALRADPAVDDRAPVVDAGGPYSGRVGEPVHFSGSATGSPIVAWGWDLDADGDFEATSPEPARTYAEPFEGLVGLRVTNADGVSEVAYAQLTVLQPNTAPDFSAAAPRRRDIGIEQAPLAFSVSTVDAEGDAVSVTWKLDGAEAASGTAWTFTPAGLGLHRVEAVLDDGASRTVLRWTVAVRARDGDRDGWGANVDCDDADATVSPGRPEVPANGKDDDCDPTTKDSDGVAPVTSDDVPSGWVKDPVRVTLTAQDADGVAATSYTLDGSDPADAANPQRRTYDAADRPLLMHDQRIRYSSIDRAGFVEIARTSAAAKVDGSAPTTTDNVPAGGWRRSPIEVTLTATESGPSGLRATWFTLNGSDPSDPANPARRQYAPANKPLLGNGQRIRYSSSDMAGNAEPVRESAAAMVDGIGPAITHNIGTKIVAMPIEVTITATDPLSGVAALHYTLDGTDPRDAANPHRRAYDPAAKPVLGDGQQMRIAARDVAGNVNAAASAIVVDQQPPSTLDDVHASAGPVTVTLDAIDVAWSDAGVVRFDVGAAGVDKTYYTTDGSDPLDAGNAARRIYSPTAKPVLQPGAEIRYASVDKVGNAEPVKSTSGPRAAVYETTLIFGRRSPEVHRAALAGLRPEVITGERWRTLTAAEFGGYEALVIGDSGCHPPGELRPIAALLDTAHTWGSVVDGNVLVLGTDQTNHYGHHGGRVIEKGIAFAGAARGKTGAFISLGCFFQLAAPGTPLTLLDGIAPGGFTVKGVECFDDAHLIATHPALEGVTDAELAGWECSVHETFDRWPDDFQPLAIARDASPVYTAADGTRGTPYILARSPQLQPISDIRLTPAEGEGRVGTPHDVRAQVDHAQDVQVRFAVVAGPHAGRTATVPLGADGIANWSYDGEHLGVDTIEATFEASDGRVQRSNRVWRRWTANAAPTAQDAAATFDEDASVDVELQASDPDGDALEYALAEPPAHGTATWLEAGRLRYTPAPNYHGSDQVGVRVLDSAGAEARALVAFTVRPVNDAPMAADDAVGTALELDAATLLANDTDVDGDELSVTGVGEPVNGAVALTGGRIRFTPTPGFSGAARFVYAVGDQSGGTDTATVTLTVTPPADTTPPACTIVAQGKDASGRAFIRFRVVDTGSGLARHQVVGIANATLAVGTYAHGSQEPVELTATATSTRKSISVTVDFWDVAGNRATCDPIVVAVVREGEQPQDETFTGISQAESRVSIYNGDPGMRKVVLIVNGVKFKETALAPREVRKFDIAAAMRPGTDNVITLRVRGRKGASALIVVADIP